MRDWKHFLSMMLGLVLCGSGVYCCVQANIGLSPWDTLSMGVANRTGILFGDAILWTSVAVLVLDVILREKIGVGTILNALLLGKVVDLLAWIDPVPMAESFGWSVALMLIGQELLCVGTYFYIAAGAGCGPRDSLMVALNRRFPRMPIGLARFTIECTVLVLGWVMGAPAGVGTAMSMFGISFLMQITFKALHFDAKSVCHESLRETAVRMFGRKEMRTE